MNVINDYTHTTHTYINIYVSFDNINSGTHPPSFITILKYYFSVVNLVNIFRNLIKFYKLVCVETIINPRWYWS